MIEVIGEESEQRKGKPEKKYRGEDNAFIFCYPVSLFYVQCVSLF